MKRHNLTEASIVSCTFSWSVISYILLLCSITCACRNKSNSIQLATVDSTSIAPTKGESNSLDYTPNAVLKDRYSEIVASVKSKPGYSLFGEFLERGQYVNVFMRLDKMQYCVLVPSDTEIKKLDNATFTQLIYPNVANKTNLDFLFKHVGFMPIESVEQMKFRTMGNKLVSINSESKNLIIDGMQLELKDEVNLPPSIRLFFIDKILN